MLPYTRGGIPSSIHYQPSSLSLDSVRSNSGSGTFCQSPIHSDHERHTVFPKVCTSASIARSFSSSPLSSSGSFCSSSITNSGTYCSSPGMVEIESPVVYPQLCRTSLPYNFDGRQFAPSPISAEMEKFFSFPTMSLTFMPCVCVPDYPVEKGLPRKICRRCSVAPPSSGTSTVAIDNKIEQAMDLVKTHLLFAVREEVDVLKVQIAELIERNNQLEYENGILRAAASPETLAKLAQPRQQQPPASSS